VKNSVTQSDIGKGWMSRAAIAMSGGDRIRGLGSRFRSVTAIAVLAAASGACGGDDSSTAPDPGSTGSPSAPSNMTPPAANPTPVAPAETPTPSNTPPGAAAESPPGSVPLENPPPSAENGSDGAAGGEETPAPDSEEPPAPDGESPPPEPTPEPEEPAAFNPCPTDGSPCRIMPLGDSITFGLGSSHQGAYRVELFRRAVVEDGHNITFVGTNPGGLRGPTEVEGQPFPRNHDGISGDTIPGNANGGFPPGVRNRVDDAIAATDPHIILLHIGTNDINGGQAAPVLENLGNLLTQITDSAPDALLVVAQIVPRQQNNGPTEAYNAGIPALVEERAAEGDHVVLADMYTPFVSNPGGANALLNDIVHPNDAGYAVMAEAWYEAIESVLP
jgi:lysophospholipase L1-like esterase